MKAQLSVQCLEKRRCSINKIHYYKIIYHSGPERVWFTKVRFRQVFKNISHVKRISEKWKSLSSVRHFATPDYTYSPWNSPDHNTGVGSSSLLQRIFPTQVSRNAGGFFISWATTEAHEKNTSATRKDCTETERKGAQKKGPLEWNALQAFNTQMCS